jgi:hypothetical protein
MSSNADFSVAVFTTPGLEPSEREILRQEAALLDRVWRAIRDIGADAARIEIDADEPEGRRQGLPYAGALDDTSLDDTSALRDGRLSVAR